MLRLVSATIAVLAVVASGWSLGCGGSDKAGGSESQESKVLTIATYEGEGHDVAEFVDAVDRLSDGSLRIDVRGRWRHDRIDYEKETIGDVRRGKVDLGEIGVRAFDRVGVADFQALVAPFSIDSYELERKVLASDLPDRMLSSLRRVGVVGIGVLPGALRKPLGVSRALIAPSDYRDAAIGIRPSGVAVRTFRALGGQGRGYVAGSDISSLDGIEADVRRLEGDRYDGPGRAVTLNVNLWPRLVALVMNPKVYSGLTSEQRETLHRAAREALEPAMKRLTSDEEEALEVMCARRQMAFRSASPSQLADLRVAVRPVYRQLGQNRATARAIDEISATRRQTDAEPPPGCGRQRATRAAAKPTPVDGLYEMTTTAKEQTSDDTKGEEIAAENWGNWRFAITGGRIAFTQENRDACTWAYGHIAVKGSRMEWSIEDGGGIAPNNAVNRPGEHFAFGWSRYRDLVTLRPVKGAISPPNFRVKPWRRIGDSPSIDDLSKTCPPRKDALKP